MYDDHFGLSGRPFQLTPDPRFWFETATHRKAMAYLGYGLAQGEGFIVITGDIGAGKTTLVGHLMASIDHQSLNAIRVVSTAIEPADLLRIVAQALGANPAGLEKAELLIAIERGLHAVARTGKRTLLIVDEAQALPVASLEELRMLSNFQAGGHAMLQIVLLGQPEFRDRLHGEDRLEQLRQRVIAIHHLDPMEPGEVADYIAHRLAIVGWSGRPDFTTDAFAAFYRGSAGVPRRLNLLAGRVMLFAAVEGLETIDGATVETVIGDLNADLPMTQTPVRAAPPLASAMPVSVDVAPVAEVSAENAFAPIASVPEAESASIDWLKHRTLAPSAAEPMVPIASATPEPLSALPITAPREDPIAMPAQSIVPDEPSDEEAEQPSDSHEHVDAPMDTSSADVTDVEPAADAVVDPTAPEPADAPEAVAVDASHDPQLLARVAALEAQVETQEAALRRVLTLLVDWVEGDAARPAFAPIRNAAA